MKRWIYKLGYPLVKLYWFVFRPKTFGVKVVVECKNEILLVRHTYGDGDWSFPGGGIKTSEDPKDTARREIFEELGIDLKYPQQFGLYQTQKEYKLDTVYCFSGRVDSAELRIDPNEIAEARWFDSKNLPKNTTAVNNILKLRNNNAL